MRNVPNNVVATLIRLLPVIIANIRIERNDTRTENAVRQIKIIIKKLIKIEQNEN